MGKIEYMDSVWGKGMKKLAGFVRKLVHFALFTPVLSGGLGPDISQGSQEGLENIGPYLPQKPKREGI